MLPADPIMCMSVVNTKLRDLYGSLDDLCEDLEEDRETLEKRLQAAGFAYDPDQNQFV